MRKIKINNVEPPWNGLFFSNRRKTTVVGFLVFVKILFLLLPPGFILSCQRDKHAPIYSAADRKLTDSMVWANRSVDSLEVLLDRFIGDENKLGIMIAQRELGKLYRENNRFDDAIEASLNGLKAARELEDTLEIIQALNNTGTNFRRIGALDEASSYLTTTKRWNTAKPTVIKHHPLP